MEQHHATTTQHADEWRAIGRLAGQGLGACVRIVGDTHAAIAQRVGSQRTAGGVYCAVEAATLIVPALAGEVLARTGSDTAVAPTQTRAGATAQAKLNGLWGDRLEQVAPALAVRMSVRVDGRDVPLTPEALAAAFPEATGHVVVFVHGLNDDDRAWHLPWQDDPTSYGQRLAAEHGRTPVHVRYNTGRRISDNGRDLSELLGGLDAAWPLPVDSFAIVGHSMGGLVSRSAAHQGDAAGAGWAARLRTVVTLGSPHLGSPMERAAHVAQAAMLAVPESAPLSRVLSSRSAGIRDLRYGAIVAEDWAGHDPDELLRDRCTSVPLLPNVRYFWVSASLTSDPSHPVGALLGDGLVRPGSASGAGHPRRPALPAGNGLHVAGADHVRLRNHPDVYRALAGWLVG